MGGIHDRIEEVLQARRATLPMIEAELARWTGVQTLVSELAAAIEAVTQPAVTHEDSTRQDVTQPDLAGESITFDVDPAAMGRVVAEALAALAITRARVSRHTVNIGVSGRARNGKSTLLQSLSGLSDEQIPTGKGQPVTAVRSRIFHSDTVRGAQLTLHTDRSFCAEVVAPYFQTLGLVPEPWTVADLERFDLAAAVAELPPRHVEAHRPMLVRLEEMRESIASYRGFLDGEIRHVDVEHLRQWLAYPERTVGVPADRRYLAVRDAVITCRFPVEEVEALGLIDLPGLGELVPHAEHHHLAGLENDVDFVLVVKRPADTNAMWSTEDQAGLGLIARACGAAAVRDFMTILINTGGCDQVNVDALTADILDRLNDKIDGRNYQVWSADAADRTVVADDVLARALTHLAAALPRMDAAVVDEAMNRCAQARTDLLAQIDRVTATVRAISRPTVVEEVIARAEGVRDEFVRSVNSWVDELRVRTGDTYEDTEFFDRVEELREDIRSWVLDGFGMGRDKWVQRAHVEMLKPHGAATHSTEELNKVRNEIARRLTGIDDVLSDRREEFWSGLGGSLRPRLNGLLLGATAEAQLSHLAGVLESAADPCPHLAETIRLALDVRLDYRTRLLPRMRTVLDVMRPESVDPSTGTIRPPLVVPRTVEGAETLFVQISDLARSVVYHAGVLLEEETQTMALALLAYGEQFEDMLIRSESSVPEFRRLVGGFRDELWPEERSGPTTSTAKVQRVVGLVKAIVHAVHATPAVPTRGAL